MKSPMYRIVVTAHYLLGALLWDEEVQIMLGDYTVKKMNVFKEEKHLNDSLSL